MDDKQREALEFLKGLIELELSGKMLDLDIGDDGRVSVKEAGSDTDLETDIGEYLFCVSYPTVKAGNEGIASLFLFDNEAAMLVADRENQKSGMVDIKFMELPDELKNQNINGAQDVYNWYYENDRADGRIDEMTTIPEDLFIG
jgi:hypothetical protein